MLDTAIELWRGRKNLARTLINMECASITLDGTGVELGAEDGKSPHFRYFKYGPDYSISFADLIPLSPEVQKIDLEEPLPHASNSQDFVLLMGVLDHVFNFDLCVREIARVLKPGGQFVGWVPGVVSYSRHPADYFRPTDEAMSRLLGESGFSDISVRSLHRGPFSTACEHVRPWMGLNLFRSFASTVALGLDRIVARVSPNAPARYPLAFFWVAKK